MALQLESTLLEDAHKLKARLEAAKVAADNAIAAHNAGLEHFKVLLDGYRAYASAYETVVRSELNKVESSRRCWRPSRSRQINKSLVDRYKAEIEGRMAAVEIWRRRRRPDAGGSGAFAHPGWRRTGARFQATVNADSPKPTSTKPAWGRSRQAGRLPHTGGLRRQGGRPG